MTTYTNSGLVLSMESVRATGVAVTGATVAAPGVFTSTAHGYSNGDIILVESTGMLQLNERLFVIVNKADNTFQLKDTQTGSTGVSTIGYGILSTMTCYKLTLGTTLNGVQDFSATGGEIKFLPTTTVSDTVDTQIINGATAMAYNLQMQWDPSDAAQILMLGAFERREEKGFRITWPNGRYALFYGSIGYSGMPGGGNQGVTTASAAVAMSGIPTYGIP